MYVYLELHTNTHRADTHAALEASLAARASEAEQRATAAAAAALTAERTVVTSALKDAEVLRNTLAIAQQAAASAEVRAKQAVQQVC